MTRRSTILLGLILALALAIVFGLSQCQRAKTAKTTADVANGQAGAAMESGGDAAGTVGNRMSADAETDVITQENRDAIQNAAGAHAPVHPALRDTAITSLCRRAAYRSHPRCVQPSPAR